MEGVKSVHELHVWQLSDIKLIASLHVLLESREGYMKSASDIRKSLHGFGIHSATIQPEFIDDDDKSQKNAACFYLNHGVIISLLVFLILMLFYRAQLVHLLVYYVV